MNKSSDDKKEKEHMEKVDYDEDSDESECEEVKHFVAESKRKEDQKSGNSPLSTSTLLKLSETQAGSSRVSSTIGSFTVPTRKNRSTDAIPSTSYVNVKRKSEQPHPSRRSSLESFHKRRKTDSQAFYRGYQLLGDSQLIRFSKNILNYECSVVRKGRKKVTKLGFCVSGQKIKELHDNLKENYIDIKKNVIILIGTNDLNQKALPDQMSHHFEMVLKVLRRNSVKQIVILTIPPIPAKENLHWYQDYFKRYNEYLLSKNQEKDVSVVDLASLFLSWDNIISHSYFEPCYANGNVDYLHLNLDGLKLLKAILDIKYFDKLNDDYNPNQTI